MPRDRSNGSRVFVCLASHFTVHRSIVMKEKLLDAAAIRDRGINYSKSQRNRLIKAGRFPAPVKPGGGRALWVEREIDAYIQALINQRDSAQPGAAA